MRHPRDENPKQAALRTAFAAPPPRRKTMFLAGLPPLPPARCGAWGLLAVQLRYIRPRSGWPGRAARSAVWRWGRCRAGERTKPGHSRHSRPLVLLIAVAEFSRAGPCGMAELDGRLPL